MNSKWLFAIAIALPVAIAPVSAKDEKSDAKSEKSEARKPKEKMICRTESATGSLIRRTRVCRTESEWRDSDAETRKGIDSYTSKQSGYSAPGSNPLGGN